MSRRPKPSAALDASAVVRRRLASEVGRLDKQAPFMVALTYPSPYRVGMSSLGFLSIYRGIQAQDGMACERAFLPDDDQPHAAVTTYESGRPLSSFPVVALSVAYELELAGVVRVLERSGIPSLRDERDERFPFVLAGGPLTFSNPAPLTAFADAIVMGEADELLPEVLAVLRDAPSRRDAEERLARLPHVCVPRLHGEALPGVARCDDALLPAWAPIRTPETELADMFLIEAERGCSRGCSYCVMRRSTNGGMRIVPKDKLLSLVPEGAKRVGLVGAAVSDHPKIVEIVSTLADRGLSVGLSSLRPDRLSDELVGALSRGGYRTLTTAMDGTSVRVRELLERRARPHHLERAAELAKKHGMARLKLYLMIGVPTETEDDVDECAAFVTELSRVVPVSLGIAPFCPKRNTPLADASFAGIDRVERLLERLRQRLKGRADVRSTSARWAWIEAVLAQGGLAEGRAVREATLAGGSFAAYKSALGKLPERERAPFVAPSPRARRRRLTVVESARPAPDAELLGEHA